MEIVNTLWQRANAGENVFYDIYTEEEKSRRSCKRGYRIVLFLR